MLRRFSATSSSIFILVVCANLSLVSTQARAQVVGGDTGYGTCADGSQKRPGEDCRERLCKSGWAQAHGLGSYCGNTSSSGSSNNSPGYCDPKVNPFCIVGNWLAKEIFGNSNSNDIDTATAAVEAEHRRMLELERQRQLEAERQRQLEAERNAQFRQDMQNLQMEMKGPKLPDESLLFKDTKTCLSQSNCPAGGDLEFKPINTASGQQTLSDSLDKLRIGACLSKMAAVAKTPDEASYLSDQASKAMQGTRLDVDVSGCSQDSTVPVLEKASVDPDVIQRPNMKGIGSPIFDCNGDQAKLKRLLAGKSAQQAAIDRTEVLLNGSEKEYAEGVQDTLMKSTQFLTDASLTAVLRSRTLLARAEMMKNSRGTSAQVAARWKLLQHAKELLEDAHDLENAIDKLRKLPDRVSKAFNAGETYGNSVLVQRKAHDFEDQVSELNELLRDSGLEEELLEQIGKDAATATFGPIGTAAFNSATDFIDLTASIYQMGYSADRAATLRNALENMRAVQWQTSDRIAELQLEIQEECTSRQPLRTAIH